MCTVAHPLLAPLVFTVAHPPPLCSPLLTPCLLPVCGVRTQLASLLGKTDDDLRPHVTPGLTGRTLKEHMKAAVGKVLPELSKFTEHDVDLSHLLPGLGSVKLYVRQPGAVITQMMTDTSRVGPNSEQLDLRGALRSSLSGSEFVRRLQRTIPDGRDQVTLNLFHDAAAVDLLMDHSLTPFTASIAQHSTSVSMSKSGHELLGYVLSPHHRLCACEHKVR